MPLTGAAESELRRILRNFRAAHSGTLLPTGEGKALEAWVLMKLANTVRTYRPTVWSVSLQRGDGTALTRGEAFSFPSQRSRIQPSNPAGPGYVLLQHLRYPERRLELHGSVQWQGRSGARHEIDVSVLPAAIGEALRVNGGGYPHGLPIVAVECKDKGGKGNLDETRQALARMYDLVLVTRPAPGWSCRIFERRTHSSWGRRSSTYLGSFVKGIFAVVRAGSFQSGAGTLAMHYGIGHHGDVYTDPAAINRLQMRFLNTLDRLADF